MKMLMQLKNKKGFTLIEMLVVILIIVILIAIAIPAVAGYRADANETADEGAAETIFNALEAAATSFPPSEAENFQVSGTTVAGIGGTAATATNIYTTANFSNDPALLVGPFLSDVESFLGATVTGTFTFNIDKSTGSVNWVTYRRENAPNIEENTMLFHATSGVTGYLDDIRANATDLAAVGNIATYKQH